MNKPKIQLFPTNQVLIKVDVDAGQVGPIGPIGLTPQLTVVDTITGAPNTNANVVISGTAANPGLTFTIPQGRPFTLAVKYGSIEDLVSNENPILPAGVDPPYVPTLFDLAIIQSNVEDEDNARLYIYDENPDPLKGGWTFISDLSGATGPVREVRFRPGTSIFEWRNNENTDWIEGKDLALTFDFEVDENNQLILTIENPDEITETINLTATAEFGPGGPSQPTVTSVKFINNNNTETSFQELGVYASFDGTELTLTNPDSTEVKQELALDFDWDGPNLGIKNPEEQNFTYQKLSPDISFETIDGVSISVVEPDAAPNPIKISPDISFRTVNNGLEISIVEPEASVDYNQISPDIYFQGTALAVMPPGVPPEPADFVDLKGEAGDASVPGTTLFRIRDEVNDIGEGYLTTVADEIRFIGDEGIEVIRDGKDFFFRLIEVDGGDFPVSEPEE